MVQDLLPHYSPQIVPYFEETIGEGDATIEGGGGFAQETGGLAVWLSSLLSGFLVFYGCQQCELDSM